MNYNYQNCVVNSLIRKIGCRPFWLNSTYVSSSECQQAKDLKKFRKANSKTYFPMDQKSFYKKTGCLIPCKYKEYQIQIASKRSGKNKGLVYLRVKYIYIPTVQLQVFWFLDKISIDQCEEIKRKSCLSYNVIHIRTWRITWSVCWIFITYCLGLF